MDSEYMKFISDEIWIKLKSVINDICTEDPDIMDRVRKMEYFINRYRRRYNLPDIKLSKEMYCWITDGHNSKIDDLKITLPTSNLEVSMKYGIFTGGRSHKSGFLTNLLIRKIRESYINESKHRGMETRFTSIDEFTPVRPIVSKISTDVINWHKPLMEHAIRYIKANYPTGLFYIDSMTPSYFGSAVNDNVFTVPELTGRSMTSVHNKWVNGISDRKLTTYLLASIDGTPYENAKKHYGVDYSSDFKIKLSYLTPPTFDMLDNKKKRRNNNG